MVSFSAKDGAHINSLRASKSVALYLDTQPNVVAIALIVPSSIHRVAIEEIKAAPPNNHRLPNGGATYNALTKTWSISKILRMGK